MKVNFEYINKYVRNFKSLHDLFDFMKDKIDFLYTHNKNYNQSQWVIIQDLKDIIDNIEINEEVENDK